MLTKLVFSAVCVVAVLVGGSAHAADPPRWERVPFTAELEFSAGGITGQDTKMGIIDPPGLRIITSAQSKSATQGAYGARLTIGFWKNLGFSGNYLYSNQRRTTIELSRPTHDLGQGILTLRAQNLHMFYGTADITLARSKNANFYVSPGFGLVRNGARTVSLVTALGSISSPGRGSNALGFNAGAGVRVNPEGPVGLRLEARYHIAGGGKGRIGTGFCPAVYPPPASCLVTAGPGYIPIQRNLVFTVGLTFRLR